MNKSRIHVYLIPGLAASSRIFHKISLPEDRFQLHLLDWFVPEKGISFEGYAKKLCKMVIHEDPVLIGVSFGGLMVQEMARHIQVRKVIIISSVKHTSEMPRRLLIARYTKFYKVLPTGLVNKMQFLARYTTGTPVNKRLKLYDKYLSIRDKYYLDWCLDKLVNWKQNELFTPVIHIHGDKDAVFPIRYIKDCISVKNGTHTMIIHKSKWFNKYLPTIILEDGSSI